MNWKKLLLPTDTDAIHGLRTGDAVLVSGTLFTARDKAHQRLIKMIENNETLPFDPTGQFIYYVGPSPATGDNIVGAAGPTTSYRMDPFTEALLKLGIKGMIGKGKRSKEVKELLPYYDAVYASSYGGAGAYLSKKIISSKLIAFEDLGPEAIYQFEVKDFPIVIVNDIYGGDLYAHRMQ